MAIPTKSDLIEQFYWEAGRWATLAVQIGRTTTGAYSETSTTSGDTYSGTDGEQGLLDKLATALDDYNIRASDWNAIATEINNSFSPNDTASLSSLRASIDCKAA